MKTTLLTIAMQLLLLPVAAQNQTIDISGNNTSNDYKSYDNDINTSSSKTVEVKMKAPITSGTKCPISVDRCGALRLTDVGHTVFS